ncbi:hypothetical protein [Vibrio sp. ER1A]|uniref:hypothetical protein n=1 Tax=Vibrio sp. ER1A TaxID=1517681 RepID=UPI0004DD4795|nr:hypothetical protein [Vibrio sp. ER1A]KFA99542.1 hypothetical protein HW45_03175 [Vibrio sp. ER1A]
MLKKLFVKNASAKERLFEEHLYAAVADELQRGEKRIGLWTKALAKSSGDLGKAESEYIKLRVQSLIDESKLSDEISENVARQKLEQAKHNKELAEQQQRDVIRARQLETDREIQQKRNTRKAIQEKYGDKANNLEACLLDAISNDDESTVKELIFLGVEIDASGLSISHTDYASMYRNDHIIELIAQAKVNS